jgi:hypothetical protein
VSCAGLVPVMTLASQTRLLGLLEEKVQIVAPRIKSGSANPAPKLATVVAGMVAGADCIDDVDVLRSGGMKALFDGVYAPSTVGTLLREFTFGHARQRAINDTIDLHRLTEPARYLIIKEVHRIDEARTLILGVSSRPLLLRDVRPG